MVSSIARFGSTTPTETPDFTKLVKRKVNNACKRARLPRKVWPGITTDNSKRQQGSTIGTLLAWFPHEHTVGINNQNLSDYFNNTGRSGDDKATERSHQLDMMATHEIKHLSDMYRRARVYLQNPKRFWKQFLKGYSRTPLSFIEHMNGIKTNTRRADLNNAEFQRHVDLLFESLERSKGTRLTAKDYEAFLNTKLQLTELESPSPHLVLFHEMLRFFAPEHTPIVKELESILPQRKKASLETRDAVKSVRKKYRDYLKAKHENPDTAVKPKFESPLEKKAVRLFKKRFADNKLIQDLYACVRSIDPKFMATGADRLSQYTYTHSPSELRAFTAQWERLQKLQGASNDTSANIILQNNLWDALYKIETHHRQNMAQPAPHSPLTKVIALNPARNEYKADTKFVTDLNAAWQYADTIGHPGFHVTIPKREKLAPVIEDMGSLDSLFSDALLPAAETPTPLQPSQSSNSSNKSDTTKP